MRYPRLVLAGVGLVTLVTGTGLGSIALHTDGRALHPASGEAVVRTARDAEHFHEGDRVVVLLTSKRGERALESDRGLALIRRIHDGLAALPGVEPERVRSFANFLDPRPDVSLRNARGFLDELPRDVAEREALLERARRFALIDGLYLSRDGRAAAFYASAPDGVDRGAFVDTLERFVEDQEGDGYRLRLTGPVVAEVMLGDAVLRDLARLVPVMIVVIAGLLFLSLRTVAGVAVPLVEVLVVLVWTLGAMGHLGVPITLVTTILPVVVMAMAVADEIHLLERVQSRLAESPRAPVAELVTTSISDVGRPIVVTSLTTAIAFFSFASASVAPLRQFGIFAGLGILIAMMLTFSMVPALLVLLPRVFLRPLPGRVAARTPGRHERLVVRFPKASVLLAVASIAAAAPGLSLLVVQDAWLANFPRDSAVVSADRDFNESFWGAYRYDLVLRSDELRFFQTREGLALLEELREVTRRGPGVGGTASHLEPFEIVANAIGETGHVSDLPRQVILRIVVLVRAFTERIGLDQFLDRKAMTARLRVFVDDADHRRAEALEAYLDREVSQLLVPHAVTVHASGDLPVAMEVVREIVANQLRSVAWSLLGIALLLAWLTRDRVQVGIVLAPVVATNLLVLGAMGYLGVPLGVATAMFTALTVGVGVDFAVHFEHGYRRARRTARCDGRAEEPCAASHATSLMGAFGSAGTAIRWNAVVLALGFLVLGASGMAPNRSLGLLLSASMACAYATTVALLPWLLSLHPGRLRTGGGSGR